MTDGSSGDTNELVTRLYEELRKLAKAALFRELPGTLQPTALIHEAYLRLKPTGENGRWAGRGEFLAAAAHVIRQVLVEHARGNNTLKRGGGRRREPLENHEPSTTEDPAELLTLHEALKSLAEYDSRCAKLIELTYFGGASVTEAAEIVGISDRSARRLIQFGRVWLRRKIDKEFSE